MNENSATIPELTVEVLKTLPLPDYGTEADKSTRGKLLLVAGSRRIPGAAILAARAALRSGCGTVRVAAPESIALHIGIAMPELMILPLPENNGNISPEALPILEAQFDVCDAAIIGPGFDEDEQSDDFARQFIARCPLPLLVDAQALCALGKTKVKTSSPQIFTPHDGEFAALTGASPGDDRATIARDLAKARNAIVAFKGRETHIAAPDGTVYRNTAGSRALGTAGSGDALSGIIGSLLAQGMDAFAATLWGVHLHALAGEALAEDLGPDGVLARDFIDRLPQVIRYLRKQSGGSSSARRVGLRPAE